jgi:peptidoglycan/LPS O-acetylase OafA/YrhL
MSAIAHKEKLFFPNLDAIRFFSFLYVFMSHSMIADTEEVRNSAWYQYFKIHLLMDGDLGVSCFFVLSGFLITYLLLKERELRGKIDVPAFYIRRTLRIWPLYYLCVLIGFFAFPLLKKMVGQDPDETADPFLSSVFLNNFNAIRNGPPNASILSVLWSVAIEEQFYLVWPLLFLLFPSRLYAYFFPVIIIASVTYRANGSSPDLHTLGVISDMALGGWGAYLAFRGKIQDWFNQIPKALNLVPYFAVVFFFFFKTELFFAGWPLVIKRIIVAPFFIWIILDQCFNPKLYFAFARLKTISHLGKYTYGLYCFHTLGILISLFIIRKLGLNQHSWQIFVFELPLSMLFSIAISYASYHLFEKHFLKIKERVAYITK